ncbi:MAG: sulfotransferase [Acidobacteriota bacterium]|nr:sulfotransferase [Acidobacteriota bacterium]
MNLTPPMSREPESIDTQERILVDPAADFTPFVVFGASKSGTTWMQRMLNAHPQVRCHFQRLIFPMESRAHLLAPVTLVYDEQKSPFGGVFDGESAEQRYNLEHAYLEKINLLRPDYVKRNHPRWSREQVETLAPFHRQLVCNMTRTLLVDDPDKHIFGTKAYTELDQLFQFFPKARVVHIVRDGRDVVVSKRFHTNRAHSYYLGDEKSALLRQLNRTRFGHRFTRYAQRNLGWFGRDRFTAPEERNSLLSPETLRKFTLDWRNVTNYLLERQAAYPENILTVKYEELLEDAREHIGRVLRHLGASDQEDYIDTLIEATSFKKAKEKGGFFRKGVSGDWRNHFTQRDVDHFKALTGDLLVRLGYEEDGNWRL